MLADKGGLIQQWKDHHAARRTHFTLCSTPPLDSAARDNRGWPECQAFTKRPNEINTQEALKRKAFRMKAFKDEKPK
jgi:hypothetical protein